MNNLRIEEVEKQTIRRGKAEVVRLRTLGEQERDPRVKKVILAKLCAARFWLEIAESTIIDRSAVVRTQNKSRKRSKIQLAAIGITIAALALVLLLSGCQTFKGALGDTAWMLQKGADNIQMQNK